MGWFTSDKELREREAQVQAKYAEIKNLLQNQQNEITVKFQDLGNLGASIMTRTDLESVYQEQLKILDTQKANLAAAISTYKEAAERFTQREQELTEREKAIVAQECDAKAAFATTLDDQMQPLRQLKSELDAKGQRILAMQEEFNKNFALQDQKLLADFQRLNASLKEQFESLQNDMLQEKAKLAEREDALNKREMALSVREAEVRQGLTSERSQMLAEFNDAKARLAQQDEALKKMAEELSQKRIDLEHRESDLANRMEAVQARETIAETGFAKQKEEMLAQLQEARDSSAKNLVELQKQASVQCDQFLKDWQGVLSDARNRMLEGLTTDVQERRAAITAENEALQQREQEIAKKENDLQLAQATVRQKEQYLAEKERMLEEHFRKIAEERITAAQAEIQAAHQANAELSQKFAATQLELAKYRSMASTVGTAAAPSAN